MSGQADLQTRMERRAARRARREGASAVEFAMIAFPFFFMLFAIMELGLVFVTDSVLENAVMETGRKIRTNEAGDSSMTAATFKSTLCGEMNIFSSTCDARTTIDVRVIPQFTGVNPPDPTSTGTFDASKLTYANGQPGDLILVRAWYRKPLFTPFLAQALSKMNDGNALLTATATFRNEPR